MNKNTTIPSNAQSKMTIDQYDLNECESTTSRFLDRFKVVKLLAECGAYKAKGVPVRVIILYIFNLIFHCLSLYMKWLLNHLPPGFCTKYDYVFYVIPG